MLREKRGKINELEIHKKDATEQPKNGYYGSHYWLKRDLNQYIVAPYMRTQWEALENFMLNIII